VSKPDLDIAPRQCAGSRVAPHPQLSGKTSDIRWVRPPYSPDLDPTELFLFAKFKTTLKRHNFQTVGEIQENAS
jgi:hypothetical protein